MPWCPAVLRAGRRGGATYIVGATARAQIALGGLGEGHVEEDVSESWYSMRDCSVLYLVFNLRGDLTCLTEYLILEI